MRCHTRPRDHQRDALRFCKGRDFVGLLMEVGAGKTWVAENWLVNDDDMLPALVLCRKDDIWTWLDQVKEHAPNTLGKPFVATPRRPRQRGKRNVLMRQQLRDNPNTPLWLANHDAAKTHYAQFARGPWKTLIIDESTDCIKKHNTDRTRKITNLGKRVSKRMIMTGTPITNKPDDIFSQLRFLSPTLLGSNFYKFRERFYWPEPSGYAWHLLKRNEHKLTEIINSCCFRVLLDECSDLPKPIYKVIRVPQSPEQARLLKQVRLEYRAQFEEQGVLQTIELNYSLSQLQKALQITGGFMYVDRQHSVHEVKTYKPDALAALLRSELAPVPKIVIWCSFVHEVRIISRLLDEMGIKHVRLWKKTKDRYKPRRQFRDDPRARIFLSQVGYGTGMNELICANTAVYYSNSLKLKDRIQSQGRTRRTGSEIHKHILYYDLLTQGGSDLTLYRRLRQHHNVASRIVDPAYASEIIFGVDI